MELVCLRGGGGATSDRDCVRCATDRAGAESPAYRFLLDGCRFKKWWHREINHVALRGMRRKSVSVSSEISPVRFQCGTFSPGPKQSNVFQRWQKKKKSNVIIKLKFNDIPSLKEATESWISFDLGFLWWRVWLTCFDFDEQRIWSSLSIFKPFLGGHLLSNYFEQGGYVTLFSCFRILFLHVLV